jgi:hypothetical protein
MTARTSWNDDDGETKANEKATAQLLALLREHHRPEEVLSYAFA